MEVQIPINLNTIIYIMIHVNFEFHVIHSFGFLLTTFKNICNLEINILSNKSEERGKMYSKILNGSVYSILKHVNQLENGK